MSDRTVARMLRAQGFSLQANTKVTEGRQHADRLLICADGGGSNGSRVRACLEDRVRRLRG